MSSPAQSVKQRGQGSKKRATTPAPSDKVADVLSQIQQETKAVASRDWDYKLALVVITLLAFATRFYGITHPNQVVFDEVHFGKVRFLTNELMIECRVQVSDKMATVRLLLPPEDLLFRRSPSVWQAPLRIRRLAGRIQWRVPV